MEHNITVFGHLSKEQINKLIEQNQLLYRTSGPPSCWTDWRPVANLWDLMHILQEEERLQGFDQWSVTQFAIGMWNPEEYDYDVITSISILWEEEDDLPF
jgi:hypothetical protein